MTNKILAIALAMTFVFISGCKTVTYSQNTSDGKQAVSAGFNEETYVWESWIFPSNKTTGK